MKVSDLLKVLSQLDDDDRVIFNLELLEEDGKKY